MQLPLLCYSHQWVELGVGSHLENVTVPGLLAAMWTAKVAWAHSTPPATLFLLARRQVKLPVIKRHPADFTPTERCSSVSHWMNYWHLGTCRLADTHSHSSNIKYKVQHCSLRAVLTSARWACLYSVWLCSGAAMWFEMPSVSSLGGACLLSTGVRSLLWATC